VRLSQAGHAQILVDRRPVDAFSVSQQLTLVTLLLRRMQQPREPHQGRRDTATVGEKNGQLVIGDVQVDWPSGGLSDWSKHAIPALLAQEVFDLREQSARVVLIGEREPRVDPTALPAAEVSSTARMRLCRTREDLCGDLRDVDRNEQARREEVVFSRLVHDAQHAVGLGVGVAEGGVYHPGLQRRRVSLVSDAKEVPSPGVAHESLLHHAFDLHVDTASTVCFVPVHLCAAYESVRQSHRREALALPPVARTVCLGEQLTDPDRGPSGDGLDGLDFAEKLDSFFHAAAILHPRAGEM
jgi:hypothetical protein